MIIYFISTKYHCIQQSCCHFISPKQTSDSAMCNIFPLLLSMFSPNLLPRAPFATILLIKIQRLSRRRRSVLVQFQDFNQRKFFYQNCQTETKYQNCFYLLTNISRQDPSNSHPNRQLLYLRSLYLYAGGSPLQKK